MRYSTLTYTGHRVQYDRGYAREIEGYPDLLIHGLLQALTMFEAARNRWDTTEPVQFEYQGLVVRADVDGVAMRTSARDTFGHQTTKGEMTGLK